MERAWAASIRHEPLDAARSRIVYTYTFRARPRWLAWLLEPLMAWAFRRETRQRFAAMRAFFAQRSRLDGSATSLPIP